MKNFLLVLAVAVVLATAGYSFLSQRNQLGVVPGLDFTEGITIGDKANRLYEVNSGVCYLRPYAATIAATSTVNVDCQGTAAWSANGVSALTGIVYGDACQLTLATTTAGATSGALHVAGVTASTTSGYIGVNISNLTGTTHTWPVSGSASGTASYLCVDNTAR